MALVDHLTDILIGIFLFGLFIGLIVLSLSNINWTFTNFDGTFTSYALVPKFLLVVVILVIILYAVKVLKNAGSK